MKKLLAALSIFASTSAMADYTFIVPQEPGAGTSVWTSIITRELEKKLGEKIVIQHIPGARDIAGPTKFHESLQHNPKTVMVAHGGNAESYLLEPVKYDYNEWDPIGAMNITIVAGHRKDANPYEQVKFAAGSGHNPDMIAMTLLVCGELENIKAYAECFKKKAKYIGGMTAPERRMAFMRGEINTMRETPSAYHKFYESNLDNVTWFNEGVLNIKTGKIQPDPNYPENVFFENVYKAKWGKDPKGDLYNAYLLVKNWRDVLQKSLWVKKGSPDAAKLRQALRDMLADKESMAIIAKENGKYEFLIGDEVTKAMVVLNNLVTKQALKDLVVWTSTVFGVEAVYKDNIAKKAK